MIKRQRTPEQIELFGRSRGAAQKRAVKNHARHHLHFNLSIDNVVIISISVILGLIFSFSLGVEQGKRIGYEKMADEPALKKKIASVKKVPVVEVPQKRKEEPVGAVVKTKKEANKFTVQVATYKKDSHVQKEAQRLKKQGYETIVLPKGKFIMLCVGSFSEKSKARVSLKKLRKKYQDCFIRRL